MASKQLRPRNSSRHKRREKKNGHSVISTDVMGNRNVEIVPVGAWVEPAANNLQPNAVLLAQIEEEKINRLKEEKENRLRTFQKEVKHRLSKINRLKQEQQIQDVEKALEQERKVVQQSFLTGDSSSRFNTCSVRQDLDKAITKRLLEKYGEDASTWNRFGANTLQSQADESHESMGKARQQLMSKKIEPKNIIFSNPEEQSVLVVRHVKNPTVKSVTHLDTAQKKKMVPFDIESAGKISENEDWANSQNDDENFESENECNVNENQTEFVQEDNEFHLSDAEVKAIKQILRKNSGKRGRPASARLSAILKNEDKNGILEQQKKQQAAISRRIFMDREREAVRENIRREKQKRKINSLKREKEAYRQELEDIAQQELDPVSFVLDEIEEERKLREEFEELQVQEMVIKRKEEIRRAREMERYLDALRHKLMEKVKRHNIQLPALCACGDSLWDTHPETCANNCFFYKNQRAYARALQSVISSIEVK